MVLLRIGRVLLFLQLIPMILGWGKDGHTVVCRIAQAYLTEDALAAVKALLPEHANGELASVCSWPDEIRHNLHWDWSLPLHFVATPNRKCNYKYCRDCKNSHGHINMCVTGAIHNYTRQLCSAYGSSKYNLTEALMFLSHFVGDVHQPLHVGFAGDLGGNGISVNWYGKPTKLHHVWDSVVIKEAKWSIYRNDLEDMIQAIMGKIHGAWSNEIASWVNGVSGPGVYSDMYASESIDLACKYAYNIPPAGTPLRDWYFYSWLRVVEKRLAQAGVRLATILNRIFTSHRNTKRYKGEKSSS